MARTKEKARAGMATKRTIAGKAKAPPAPPWWGPMGELMDIPVCLWNVEARGACGILSYAFGKLQHHPLIEIPVVERDVGGKADLAAGIVLTPSAPWRIYEAFVRDAVSAMASQALRTAPHGPDAPMWSLKEYLLWGCDRKDVLFASGKHWRKNTSSASNGAWSTTPLLVLQAILYGDRDVFIIMKDSEDVHRIEIIYNDASGMQGSPSKPNGKDWRGYQDRYSPEEHANTWTLRDNPSGREALLHAFPEAAKELLDQQVAAWGLQARLDAVKQVRVGKMLGGVRDAFLTIDMCVEDHEPQTNFLWSNGEDHFMALDQPGRKDDLNGLPCHQQVLGNAMVHWVQRVED